MRTSHSMASTLWKRTGFLFVWITVKILSSVNSFCQLPFTRDDYFDDRQICGALEALSPDSLPLILLVNGQSQGSRDITEMSRKWGIHTHMYVWALMCVKLYINTHTHTHIYKWSGLRFIDRPWEWIIFGVTHGPGLFLGWVDNNRSLVVAGRNKWNTWRQVNLNNQKYDAIQIISNVNYISSHIFPYRTTVGKKYGLRTLADGQACIYSSYPFVCI